MQAFSFHSMHVITEKIFNIKIVSENKLIIKINCALHVQSSILFDFQVIYAVR